VVVVLKNGRKKSDDDENTEREKSAFETVAEHEGAVEVGLLLLRDSNFFNRVIIRPIVLVKRSFSPLFFEGRGRGKYDLCRVLINTHTHTLSNNNRMRAFLCGFALFALLATLSAVFSSSSSSSFDLVSKSATTTTAGGGGRRLLSAGGGECKPTKDWEKVGGLIGYFVGVLYLFLGIAIVCDDYFVASLEAISEALGLSDDVAGATFMAAGSSAPELASSLMSLVNANASSSIGIGTIVGSAIFNILIIIGITTISVGDTLILDWKPLVRDCTFYGAAVVGIATTFSGGRVDWWEGGIYVGLYGLYILFMTYNEFFMRKVDLLWPERAKTLMELNKSLQAEIEASQAETGEAPSDGGEERPSEEGATPNISAILAAKAAANVWRKKTKTYRDKIREETGKDPDDRVGVSISSSYISKSAIRKMRSDALLVEHVLKMREKNGLSSTGDRSTNVASVLSIEDAREEEELSFALPENKKQIPMYLLSMPWYCVFALCIPNCQKEKWKTWYPMSFLMSIVFIGFITHFMVEWCTRIGCILKIPPVVMGTTVLAAGTSIPDALSSIAVAKDGLANMAVANAVGSNVFDIWLGLGLPWLCYLSWQTPNYLIVTTNELIPSTLILAGVLFIYFGSVAASGFTLSPKIGWVYIGLYVLYAIYNIVCVWILDIYKLE